MLAPSENSASIADHLVHLRIGLDDLHQFSSSSIMTDEGGNQDSNVLMLVTMESGKRDKEVFGSVVSQERFDVL